MERNKPWRQEAACFFTTPMSERVTQITRFHHLADVMFLLGSERKAELCRAAAVSYSMCIITLTERDSEQKKALEKSLEWLRRRDCEMHRTVVDTLEQAQAKKDLIKTMRSGYKMNGGRRRRR